MSEEQPTNADILQELRQIKTEVSQTKAQVDQLGDEVGQLKTEVSQVKTEVGQLKTEVGQLKKGQTAIQISIARFDEKFDAVENQLGEVKLNVKELGVAVHDNTMTVARVDGESTATSAVIWVLITMAATVAITTIMESKFHWLKNNWGWMFGNGETRRERIGGAGNVWNVVPFGR